MVDTVLKNVTENDIEDVDKLKEKIKVLEVENLELEEENEKLESENCDLTKENNRLQTENEDLKNKNIQLDIENQNLKSEEDNLNTELSHFYNDKEKVEKFINGLNFPTMLRKQWSGREVQEWLDEKIKNYKSNN
tara:strand:+ start:1669 stop:2073 length:405 start_codon:yes stop_codon:yes gene_type:complete